LDGDYLIKKYPIFYLPSTSMLQFYRNIRPNKLSKCSAFALDKGQKEFFFKKEAIEIAKLFDTNPFIDPDEDTIKSNLNADVLHFATHGLFDTVSPMNSSLELANNKKITAKDIFGDMRFDSDLVTLSACGTGLSKVRHGDELLGLTRAFIYAGSSSVLVSLWSVSDRSTKDLMFNFYDNLKNKKMSKVKALQQAQLTLMKVHSSSHPYYWAPFILVGYWR
jgi:CHAT domain-containing protein